MNLHGTIRGKFRLSAHYPHQVYFFSSISQPNQNEIQKYFQAFIGAYEVLLIHEKNRDPKISCTQILIYSQKHISNVYSYRYHCLYLTLYCTGNIIHNNVHVCSLSQMNCSPSHISTGRILCGVQPTWLPPPPPLLSLDVFHESCSKHKRERRRV